MENSSLRINKCSKKYDDKRKLVSKRKIKFEEKNNNRKKIGISKIKE